MVRHWTRYLGVGCCLMVVAVTAQAQTVLVSSSGMAREGESTTVHVFLEHSGSEDFSAWSFGVCNDPLVANVVSVADGATTAEVNNGAPPDFQQVDIEPFGWAVTTVISTSGGTAVLSPGLDHHLYTVTYEMLSSTESLTTLDFCDTIGGIAPVPIQFQAAGGIVVPSTAPGLLEVYERPTDFYAPFVTVPFTTPEVLTADMTLQAQDRPGGIIDWHGVGVALAYDTGRLSVVDVVPAGPIAALEGGPSFFGVTTSTEGLVVGVVFDLLGAEQIRFEELSDMMTVTFETVGPVDALGGVFPVEWASNLGDPPGASIVVGSGTSFLTIFHDGFIRFAAPRQEAFLRGDCDGNGSVAIGDPIELLQHLFGGLSVSCYDACDIDLDGNLDIVDPVRLLGYLFVGGGAPPAPFPSCGDGPSLIGCETSACSP